MRKLQIDKGLPKEKVWMAVLWMLSLSIHLAVMNHFVGWICTDTAGYWLHAATFTGHDWSEAIRGSSMYYSWGYSLWLAIPFVLAPENMAAMARIAISMNALFCSLTFVFLFLLGRRLFHGVDRRLVMACAFIVSIYPAYILETSVALSECLLFFLYVLELWLLVEYLYSGKAKLAVLSGACCGYMYLVHHRTLGIVLAFLCMLAALYLQERDWRQIACFLAPLLLCIVASVLVDQWLAAKEMGDSLYTSNTYRSMARRMPAMLRLGRLLSMAQNVVGEGWYILAGTYAMAGMGIIFAGKKICGMRFKGKPAGRAGIGRRTEKEGILYFFAAVSLLFSMGISIYTTARQLGAAGGGRIDVVFYGRYFENTLSFFMLAGLIEAGNLGKKRDTLKEMVLLALLTTGSSIAVFYFTQTIQGNGVNCFSVAAVLSLYSYPDLEFSVLAVSLFHMAIMVAAVYLLWMDKKAWKAASYGLIAASFLYTGYHAVVNVDSVCREHALVTDYPTQNEDAKAVNAYIREHGIDRFGVYLESAYSAFSYQMMNPQKKVYAIPSLDEMDEIKQPHGRMSHVIIPRYLKEMMVNGRLEMETANYAVYDLASDEK